MHTTHVAAGKNAAFSTYAFLFASMSTGEIETYARDAILPDWFTTIVGGAVADGQETRSNE